MIAILLIGLMDFLSVLDHFCVDFLSLIVAFLLIGKGFVGLYSFKCDFCDDILLSRSIIERDVVFYQKLKKLRFVVLVKF